MRRTLIPACAVVAALSATVLLAPTASATGKPKGDNGTVKIHDAKTGEELMKNEPHVCTFYLDGFKFDGAQKVDWTIKGHAPTKDLEGTSGSLTLDGSGHERTADLSLPDGHYKLTWKFDNENGAGKHKAFWVDCAPGEEPTKPGEEPTTPGEEPAKPGEEPTTPGEPGSSASPTPGAPGEQSTGGNGDSKDAEGDLAETGSSAPVGIIAAAAVALAGVGGFLVTRRRKAAQG